MNETESPAPRRRQALRPLPLLIALYAFACVIGVFQIFFRGQRDPSAGWAARFKAKTPAIAVISVYGPIMVSQEGPLSQTSSSDRIVRKLKAITERDDIKAVVLRINSPGGSVGAVQEIYEELIKVRNSGKKIVASVGDVAASGGYYIAAAADKIYAEPGTITGSIGVIFQLGNVQELFKKIGVKIEAVKSSEHKDIASPFRPLTDKERKIIQAIIDDAYGQFLDAIVQGRKMDKAKVAQLADGRIFTGNQAHKEGLIDGFGNLETAITAAKELAGIQVKPKILRDEEGFGRLFSLLSGRSNIDLLAALQGRSGVRFAYLWEHALP